MEVDSTAVGENDSEWRPSHMENSGRLKTVATNETVESEGEYDEPWEGFGSGAYLIQHYLCQSPKED